jgi:hypothetical protein
VFKFVVCNQSEIRDIMLVLHSVTILSLLTLSQNMETNLSFLTVLFFFISFFDSCFLLTSTTTVTSHDSRNFDTNKEYLTRMRCISEDNIKSDLKMSCECEVN